MRAALFALSLLLSACAGVQGGDYEGPARELSDPLASNWTIQETRLSETRVRLELRMKRFHGGGEGEAMSAFRRRADELVGQGGFTGYTIANYQEGLDSNWFPQRYAFGELEFRR